MDVGVGAVCTAGQRVSDAVQAERHPDNYVVGSNGRVCWLESGRERALRSAGAGVLLAAIDGRAADGRNAVPSAAIARVIAKLYETPSPRDPLRLLLGWLADAHTRMFWKAKADARTEMGAAVAVAWLLDDVLHWAEIGSTRAYLHRDGVLHRLAKPWPMAASQKMILGSNGLGDDAAVHFRRDVNCGSVQLAARDQVLLATDGFYSRVDDASAADLLRHVSGAQATAVSCMERAVARGSLDDVTVLLADVVKLGATTQATQTVVRTEPPARRRRQRVSRRTTTVP
jgi:hypothetical protein